MKFEMKKRILALALAGTTAFSVFGAAMSANAANYVYWNNNYSSHINASDSAFYTEYKPAGQIHWSTEAATTNTLWPNQTVYTIGTPSTTEMANASTGNKYPTFSQGSTLYVDDPDTFNGNDDFYKIENVAKLPGYYTDLTAFMADKGYSHVDVDSESTFTLGTGTAAVTYTLYTDGTSYYAFTAADLEDNADNGMTKVTGLSTGDSDVYYSVVNGSVAKKVYIPTGGATANTLNADITSFISTRSGNYYIAGLVDQGYTVGTNYNATTGASQTIAVVNTFTGSTNTVWTDANYTILNPTVGDFDAIMDEEVENGVVYLYDYYYDETYPARVDADTFADGWADGSLANIIKGNSTTTSGVIEAETGYSYRSVRGDVLDAWEDFLDDLGIADASAKEITAWAENIYENYVYTYYDATAVVDVTPNTDGSWTITIANGRNVDLYNFGDLLEDILELAPAL